MGSGNGDICRVLLAAGADVHARTCRTRTPLHTAAFYGAVDCAEQLLTAGADAASKDADRATPAAIARRRGHKQCAALLDEAAGAAARWGGLRRAALTAWVLAPAA